MNPRAMVLIFEERLTHSVWVDYGGRMEEETGGEIPETEEQLIETLKQGVRDGEWVGWRLIRVEREVLGNAD